MLTLLPALLLGTETELLEAIEKRKKLKLTDLRFGERLLPELRDKVDKKG